MIDSKILLDSISPKGERVITFVTHAPKFLDGEVEKHGNIATNSSSSRALSFPATSRQGVPFIPDTFQTPAKSMHGSGIINEELTKELKGILTELFYGTISALEPFKDKVHKQHLNRYLEPWTLQTKVWTANLYAYENFFKLRISEFADPNIQDLAKKMKVELVGSMKDELSASIPVERCEHLPLISEEERDAKSQLDCLLASAGRVARISFKNMQTPEIFEDAFRRADMLKNNDHKSCFEHQLLTSLTHLTELTPSDRLNLVMNKGTGWTHTDGVYLYSGRVRGWVQGRKILWNDSLDQE